MIVIIDYGMGNLRSVQKAFERVGASAQVSQEPRVVQKATKLVLPGVGAFQDARQSLETLRLVDPIVTAIRRGIPFLGLCLGLQLLFTESEEGGRPPGFNLIEGKVRRFPKSELKVPHIGWNQIEVRTSGCPLLKGIADRSYFYFVHSYYVDPIEKGSVAAQTSYGLTFASMVWRGNIFATQFHPEKSQRLGLKILENFVAL